MLVRLVAKHWDMPESPLRRRVKNDTTTSLQPSLLQDLLVSPILFLLCWVYRGQAAQSGAGESSLRHTKHFNLVYEHLLSSIISTSINIIRRTSSPSRTHQRPARGINSATHHRLAAATTPSQTKVSTLSCVTPPAILASPLYGTSRDDVCLYNALVSRYGDTSSFVSHSCK